MNGWMDGWMDGACLAEWAVEQMGITVLANDSM